jgi:hypothetical protein
MDRPNRHEYRVTHIAALFVPANAEGRRGGRAGPAFTAFRKRAQRAANGAIDARARARARFPKMPTPECGSALRAPARLAMMRRVGEETESGAKWRIRWSTIPALAGCSSKPFSSPRSPR